MSLLVFLCPTSPCRPAHSRLSILEDGRAEMAAAEAEASSAGEPILHVGSAQKRGPTRRTEIVDMDLCS